MGEGAEVNLKQFNINLVKESDFIQYAESIDINVRFPVFKLEKPVYQWNYSFNLKDFNKAVQYVDENCTQERLRKLVEKSG